MIIVLVIAILAVAAFLMVAFSSQPTIVPEDRVESPPEDAREYSAVTEKLMGQRTRAESGYTHDYIFRPFDKKLRGKISRRENVLLIGAPLSGKSRALIEAVKKTLPSYELIIPELNDFTYEDLRLTSGARKSDKNVLLLDDVDEYAIKQNFASLLQEYARENIPIVATCRTGQPLKIVSRILETELALLGEIIEIPRIETCDAESICTTLGKTLPEKFDGTLGRLFLDQDTISHAYDACDPNEKIFFSCARRLCDAGVIWNRGDLSLERIRTIAIHLEQVQLDEQGWKAMVAALAARGLLTTHGDFVRIDRLLFDRVLTDTFNSLEHITETAGVFPNDFDVLFRVAVKLLAEARVSKPRETFLKQAIEILVRAMDTAPRDKTPERHSMVQYNLGNAYLMLAPFEATALNLKMALEAFHTSLAARPMDRFSMQFASAEYGLGEAFRRLADHEQPVENLRLAIEAYNEALKVRSQEHFVIDYGLTRTGLGHAWLALAEFENRQQHADRAIEIFLSVLEIFDARKFPAQHARIQNILGQAYLSIAQTKDQSFYSRQAVQAHSDAVKIFTINHYPREFAETMHQRGDAYISLAESTDRGYNILMAIDSYKEALRVRKPDTHPVSYAATQNSLGEAYRMLAEMENLVDNCKMAVEAFDLALNYRNRNALPLPWAATKSSLGMVFRMLGESEQSADFLAAAERSFLDALTVHTKARYPKKFAALQNNLGVTYRSLAKITDFNANCSKARDCYETALTAISRENDPGLYSRVQTNIKTLEDFITAERVKERSYGRVVR